MTSINLQNISVWGVDTHGRAASLRQWFTRRQSLASVRIPILQDVSFTARAGDRVGVIGMNGSGKSSLLKVISGNYPIHAGTRRVEGVVVPLIEMGAGFEPEASGRRNIKLTFAYRGKLREYSRKKEEEIIAFAELGDKIDLPLKTYSSGMTARLAFSSAIFQNPEILLLDEIFAAGDAGFVEKSRAMLMSKMDEAAITIMVNHAHDDMMKLCNRFVLINGGRVLNDGAPKDVLKQYMSDILRLPEENAEPARAMG